MSVIIELRKKRTQNWDAAKAFLESKRDKDGIVSPEDTAVYEKMEAQVVEIGHQIELLERQRDLDDSLSQIVGTPYLPAIPGTEGINAQVFQMPCRLAQTARAAILFRMNLSRLWFRLWKRRIFFVSLLMSFKHQTVSVKSQW